MMSNDNNCEPAHDHTYGHVLAGLSTCAPKGANVMESAKKKSAQTMLDHQKIRHYFDQIEMASLTDQFHECAWGFMDLIEDVRVHLLQTDWVLQAEQKDVHIRIVGRAQYLACRCQDGALMTNEKDRVKLRDEIRNGMILLGGDLLSYDWPG